MRYEHKTLVSSSLVNEDQLDELGNQGWELIIIIEWQDNFYFYFKRLVD